MKKFGYADRTWSVREAIKRQVQLEDAVSWSKRQEPISEYAHQPSSFHLTETAKHVFGSAVYFIKSLPKL